MFSNSSLIVTLVTFVFMIALTGFALTMLWVFVVELNLLIRRVKSDRIKKKAENDYIWKIEEIHNELY